MSRRIQSGCFPHFKRRVHERIGPEVDADTLWHALIAEITRCCTWGNTEHLTFITRINRAGRRLWRVSACNMTFFVIFDHRINCPITILPPKGLAHREGGAPINLAALSQENHSRG